MNGNDIWRDPAGLKRSLYHYASLANRTPHDVAAEAGIDMNRFENILDGRASMTPVEALRMSDCLRITPDMLFTDPDRRQVLPLGGRRIYKKLLRQQANG